MPDTRTTTQRGYGTAHMKARQAALARLRDGDSCAQCWHDKRIHHPMYQAHAARLDLSHNDTRTGYIGLSWRACNRQEAAIRGNRLRGLQRHTLTATQSRHSRIW
jgi:hypothetical protein